MGKNKIPETGIYDARQLGRGRMPVSYTHLQLDEAAAAICRLHLFSSAVAMPIFAVYFPANGMCQGVGEGFHATFFALLALGLRVIFAYALHNTCLLYTSRCV